QRSCRSGTLAGNLVRPRLPAPPRRNRGPPEKEVLTLQMRLSSRSRLRSRKRMRALLAREAVEGDVDDRRGEEGEHLREEQAAHDGDAEGLPQLGAGAVADGQRDAAKQGGESGHEDRPEAQE